MGKLCRPENLEVLALHQVDHMLLKDKQNDVLVEILDTVALINPSTAKVPGRVQEGEEEQDPENFDKSALIFPSGENLPRCWVDAEYQAQT